MNKSFTPQKFITKYLIIILGFFSFTGLYSQEISDYYGTYTGKLIMYRFDGSEYTSKDYSRVDTNIMVVTISAPDKIHITFSVVSNTDEFGKTNRQNTGHRSCHGIYDGAINKDLSFEVTGSVDIHWITYNEKGELKPDRPIGFSSNEKGKITGNTITGGFKVQSYTYNFELRKEKCDINIIVPKDVRPGSDFYVIIEKTGCVSYSTIYYNGSDKPIPKWDGKEVDVEVQFECCDHSAFIKKIKVPDFGSNQNTVITTMVINEGGPLPVPPSSQILKGTGLSLALTTLLQLLLKGGGSKTVPPAPPDDTALKDIKKKGPVKPDLSLKDTSLKDTEKKDRKQTDTRQKGDTRKEPPAKDPTQKDHIKTDPSLKDQVKKDIPQKDLLKVDTAKKDLALKDHSREQAKPDNTERIRLLKERQEELIKLANQENIALTSKVTFVKNLFQTIPLSITETRDTAVAAAKKTYNVAKYTGLFAKELYDNPAERRRLNQNMMNTMEHFKSSATKYFDSGKWKEDAKQFYEMNRKFKNDLWNDPVNTAKEFLNNAFGGHAYKNAFNPDKPLGERLLNLGWAYTKTYMTISTGGSGNILLMLFLQQKTLLVQKLAPYFPELKSEAKKQAIIRGVKIKANNFYYTDIDPKPENTTMVHNLNNMLEDFNRGHEPKIILSNN